MKRIMILCSILMLCLALVSCNNEKSENVTDDGVTKLESSDVISFAVDDREYRLSSEVDEDNRTITFNLSSEGTSTEDELDCSLYKCYEIIKNGKSYLYLCTVNESFGCNLYIYDLNETELSSPVEFEGSYNLYRGEIENIDSFELQKVNYSFGSNASYKNFYVGDDGIPVSNDKYAYFDVNCLTDGAERGEGAEIIATIAMECEVGDTSSEVFEQGEIKEGTKLKYYRTDDDKIIDFLDESGRIIRFTISKDENGNKYLNDVYPIYSFENVPNW